MQPAHNLLYNQVKAGLGYIDPDQISHKITEVSKDTKFYQKQKERSKLIDGQIDDLKLKLQFASKSDLHLAKVQVDSFINSLEKKRNLDQIIFHADLDAFFASVEVINDPTLKGIPFAVGGSIKHGVISTSSYEARKFGVRSGMAVFISLSLCPELRIVKPSGRYAEFSELVQSEFAYYDPNYISFGLDEASMNMTEYLQKTQQTAVEVAKEIQEKVFNKTKLTISIGIGPTNQLAKIASDINKPNGIYEIPRDVDGMMDFIRSLSVRKIPGIGGVTERKLQELNFLKMGDILDRKEEIWFLFSQAFCKFIFSSALGIQHTIKCDERKSISKEETFEATDDLFILMDKVERMAEKLALKLQRDSLRCKTVTVKFKTHDFQTITHAFTFKQDTSKTSDITGAAIKILMEEHQSYRRKLRLIGVRVSNLLYPGQKVQKSISDWISRNKNSSMNQQSTCSSFLMDDEDDEWEQEEEKEISKSETIDHSIKSYFKEGFADSDGMNIDLSNPSEIDQDENLKKDDFGYSIKRYFKEGNNEVNESIDYQSERSIDSASIQNKGNESDFGGEIMKYFKKGSIDDDIKSYYQKNDKRKEKKPNDFSIKSYFNKKTENKSSMEEERQIEKNKFDSDDENNEKNEKLDYHFQSGTSFDKSSDYDDDDLVAKNDRYLSTINFAPKPLGKTGNIRGKKRENYMKKIIENYFPESMWESELKKMNQLPRSTILNPNSKKTKTKAGTLQIGSFFDSTQQTHE